MARSIFFAQAAFCCCLILGGCAGSVGTSSHEMEGDRSVYRSGAVPLQPDLRTAPLASVNELAMRATASCPGEDCTPEAVQLTLVNQSGAYKETRFDTIEIIIDGVEREWGENVVRDPNQGTARAGEFLQIEVEPSLFRSIAEAQDVRIMLGTTRYRLVHGRRSTFRQMAEEMGLN